MMEPIQQDFFESLAQKPKTPVAKDSVPRDVNPTTRTGPNNAGSADHETWQIDGHTVSIRFVRHPRSRRFRLTWLREGTARCTLPPRGSMAEARRFIERNVGWLLERVKQHSAPRDTGGGWSLGTRIFFKGVETSIEADTKPGYLRLADFVFQGPANPHVDLRGPVRHALRWFASSELPLRVIELAAKHNFPVKRVTVRDQRTRWGSCSARHTISLNWRLVQTPPYVVDYIILHELAHTRHMNHSDQFWAEVARVCPNYDEAEAWLKTFGRRLL